jgi:hypothetical protein
MANSTFYISKHCLQLLDLFLSLNNDIALHLAPWSMLYGGGKFLNVSEYMAIIIPPSRFCLKGLRAEFVFLHVVKHHVYFKYAIYSLRFV